MTMTMLGFETWAVRVADGEESQRERNHQYACEPMNHQGDAPFHS